MDFKPTIFIGSSTEGKHVAEQVMRELSDVADCKIWYGQFDAGNSAYEDLVNKLSLYDYGILVATADDETYSRKIGKISPRDNIVFEFGLFAGRLGRQKAFLMAEKGIKIPSDLNGITLPFFSTTKQGIISGIFNSSSELQQQQRRDVSDNCKTIRDHIKRRATIFDFGFLPSTSLAYGYYHNFVLKSVTNLLEAQILKLGNTCNFPKQCQREEHKSANREPDVFDGMNFSELTLSILIPNDLSADMFDKVKEHRKRGSWKLIKIDAGSFRPFDFYIEADKSINGVIQLSDIPLTLNALSESIKAYVGKSYIGFSEAERLLEQREIHIFKSVLDYLISSNPLTKHRVKTEIVDI